MASPSAEQLSLAVAKAWRIVLSANAESQLEDALAQLTSVSQQRGPMSSLKIERVCKQAQEKLCLLLCQMGKYSTAAPLLRDLGYRYRLCDEAIRFVPGDGATTEQLPNTHPSLQYVSAFDTALPEDLFQRMHGAFAEHTTYWDEHRYSDGTTEPPSPYFSYIREINQGGTSLFDVFVARLQELAAERFPDVASATNVEFWAHRRRNTMSGHQFHFDSDREGDGGVRNPIVSTVLYMDECGGPTLVTNQPLNAEGVCNKGWLVFPKRNRVCVFDGKVLHGVLPGYGVQPPEQQGRVRTTLMVAFWKAIDAFDGEVAPDTCHEACMKWPSVEDTAFSWQRRLASAESMSQATGQSFNKEAHQAVAVCPRTLDQVWVDVDEAENEADGLALNTTKQLPCYDEFFQGF